MTYYKVGYGKPPKAHRFQKGRSGNPPGRKKKPIPTIANLIEDAWMAPITVSKAGVPEQATGFELILLHLLAKIADGSSRAHRVLRKYEAFAKTKTRTLHYMQDKKALVEAYLAHMEGRKYKMPSRKRLKLTQTKDLSLNARIARMRAGLEPAMPVREMTPKQSMEMDMLSLKQMPVENDSTEKGRRRTTGKLTASEIFDKAINSTVTLHDGHTKIAQARLQGSIKLLLMRAAKGDIKCADMLANMHAYSTKYGDFVLQTRHEIMLHDLAQPLPHCRARSDRL